MSETPFVESVLHATDFSETSQRAFAHALAIALLRKAKLTLLHAGSDSSMSAWTEFPAVRETLERWGLLEAGAERAEVFRTLSVQVEKVLLRRRSATRAIVELVESDEPDLLVLGAHSREGLPHWLKPSSAESAARRSGTMTLFVPDEADGFVALEDGSTSLRRILIPVAESPNASESIVRATRAAQTLGEHPVRIDILHVGEGSAPDYALQCGEAWEFHSLQRGGDPAEEIVAAAREQSSDLIVMATAGHDGVLDMLRGSVTERVLRAAPCPLLAVPANSV